MPSPGVCHSIKERKKERKKSDIAKFIVNERKFYSSFNGIFGKIGRVASEEVPLNLLSAKMYTLPAVCV